MKNRFMIGLFIATIMIIFNSCANDDQATVTINLIRNDLTFNNKEIKKEYSIIDKFISFIFMSSDAHAKWSDDHTATYSTLSLKITGDDMSEITAQLPKGATSYTIQVPSGSNRKFIFVNNTTLDTVPKNWGGSSNVDLAPGESVNLNINMIPMTVLAAAGGTGQITFSWQNTAAGGPFPTSITSIDQIRIYKSLKPEGPYTFLKSASFLSGSNSTYDTGLMSGTYYYKASIMSTYGEGVQCDYASGTAL